MSEVPDRNLALELVRVTESAATFASQWIGRGDKIAADQAAVDAMRLMLDTVAMRGVVVIGEGEKDEAPMLFNGEEVGDGVGPEVDVAVDPLEGTRLTALGMPNAISVIAVSERGTMFFPGAALYMDKIAVGPEAADAIDIDASPTANLQAVADAKGVDVNDLTVVVAQATERRAPHAIPIYAIRVADDFHRFYHEHRVLESEQEAFRLALVRAVQLVIARCLDLVGVDAPERM